VLGDNGKLYDGKKGVKPPKGVKPMPLLTDKELKAFPEVPIEDVVPHYVGRYNDMMALAGKTPCKVIGKDALIKDRPGFEVEFLTRGSIAGEPYATKRHEVLMVMRGHWKLGWKSGETALAPGDVCAVPPNLKHSLTPSMTGEASLFRVRNTDDKAGATWKGKKG
jgi:mannose-6-phosphate isomerase-like protein (cupin superfamily)